jgi:hypothetical protein
MGFFPMVLKSATLKARIKFEKTHLTKIIHTTFFLCRQKITIQTESKEKERVPINFIFLQFEPRTNMTGVGLTVNINI